VIHSTSVFVYGPDAERSAIIDALRAGGISVEGSEDVATARQRLENADLGVWVCIGDDPNCDDLLGVALEQKRHTLLIRNLERFDAWRPLYATGGHAVSPNATLPQIVALVHRLLSDRGRAERLEQREQDLETVVELTQSLASSLDIRKILFTLVSRTAELMRVDRCSIVLAGKGAETGYVVATSDDATLQDLPIRLSDYPEIRTVLDSGEPLVIRDASRHALLAAVRQDSEAATGYRSLALVPISHQKRPLGVLFFRNRGETTLDDEQLALLQTIANATAIALRNARVLQTLRTETIQSTEALVSAERRVKVFERYADFFKSAADGMVVSDHDGRVLFANPRASEITGYTARDLTADARLAPIMIPVEARKLDRLYAGFRKGFYPNRVDVRFRHKKGKRLILSVSFSSLLQEENAVLFTFRDVTTERQTADKLRQTTAFFERVIESSVDAIVSADLAGKVLIFNSAAARIFGYSREQVIGKMNVERLYPPGVARSVMRKIRGPGFGGENRLEDLRVDMLGSDSQPIAVNISAAFIFDGRIPIGTVGVFTDVRDKLRMERRLLSAQEELRQKEKSEAVAQLAGTTAHELNQPLTSILSAVELLARRIEPGSPALDTANGIAEQAERMAEIVRKIGRITKFETKSYVGGAKILDLERSVDESSSGGVIS
jgi:PAS domain S-box-containing protein